MNKAKKREKTLEEVLLEELRKIIFGERSTKAYWPYEIQIDNVY